MKESDKGPSRTGLGARPLSFALAVGISLVLHGGFFYALPASPLKRPPPSIDTIFVDLQKLQGSSAPLPPEPLDRPTPGPEAPSEADAEQPASPIRPPEEPHPAQAAPEGKAPSPVPLQVAPSAPPPAPEAQPSRSTATSQERSRSSAAAPPKPQVKSLAALLPTPKELSSFRSKKIVDPTDGTAKDAVLGLGEADPRYQRYLDQVYSTIYASWHVDRNLLVAGGARRVLTRFTLTSLGMVESPQVVESSGNPTLDAEALEALRRARIPPFPTHWTLERLSLFAQFEVVYR